MGSKRMMLANGLGDVLTKESKLANRFVDLFCGAGVVSWFVATSRELPVLSCDLQSFATTMAAAVVKRTDNEGLDQEIKAWMCRVRDNRKERPGMGGGGGSGSLRGSDCRVVEGGPRALR